MQYVQQNACNVCRRGRHPGSAGRLVHSMPAHLQARGSRCHDVGEAAGHRVQRSVGAAALGHLPAAPHQVLLLSVDDQVRPAALTRTMIMI